MKDRLVIDLETKNTFNDVGGKDKLRDLAVSLVGVYAYNRNELSDFREDRLADLGPMLQDAGLISGFNIKHFDLPVLNKYYNFNLEALPQFDLLKEIEEVYGNRVGLDALAKTNLGAEKSGHGLDAIRYYANKDWESLEKYCLQDVALTRDLYELAKKQGYLLVPDRLGEKTTKVELVISEPEEKNSLF